MCTEAFEDAKSVVQQYLSFLSQGNDIPGRMFTTRKELSQSHSKRLRMNCKGRCGFILDSLSRDGNSGSFSLLPVVLTAAGGLAPESFWTEG